MEKNIKLHRTGIAFLIIWIFIAGGGEAVSKEIYFYNPDANLRNISKLKGAMSKFFKDISYDIEFQPFLKFNTFFKQVISKHPEFILISSLHINMINQKIGYYPVMVSSHEGKIKYSKILITKNKNNKLKPGMKLALTGMGKEGKKILDSILFKSTKVKADDLAIIWVSKDMDAILALSFGQVDYALVSPANLEILKKATPMMVKDINNIMTTSEILNLTLCSINEKLNTKDQNIIKESFKKMNTDSEGKKILKMLNSTEWIIISDNILSEYKKGVYEK